MALFSVVTKEEFEEKVKNNNKVVLVDFWAPWCAPCRMIGPILEDLSKKMDNDVDVVKVNIEESPEAAKIAEEHGVQGIPNMQVYKNGAIVDQFVGMRPAGVIEEDLKQHIG